MNKETEAKLNELVERIKGYKQGFEFTVRYCDVPTKAQLNGLDWVLRKAKELGYIKSIAIGHSLEDLRGKSGRFCSEETFVRL